mgnify:FL=1
MLHICKAIKGWVQCFFASLSRFLVIFAALMAAAKTVAFHTLGCKLNYSETSTLSRQMESEGFEKKEFDDLADVYVINTCSVTDNADKECRQLVRRIQRKAPESLVVITGCYAQLKPKEIAEIPGVDLVLGACLLYTSDAADE